MKTLKTIGALMILIMAISCVSQRKYTDLQSYSESCENELKDIENELLVAETNLANEMNRTNALEKQMEYFKSTNTDLLDRLSDLSVVSKSGAESIKKSLEALNEQNRYIKDLTSSMQRKDSLNLVLVMNLKRSLSEFDDEDINIEVKKGVVYISISDRMLFQSGSYRISQRAEDVIGRIAQIVNDHSDLEILVEGHTDNVPISNECMVDNWDLSVKRATSIARLMQNNFQVDPQRITAGGRSEYFPKETNETVEGRAINRRTEIIVLPKLDQFFALLNTPLASTDD